MWHHGVAESVIMSRHDDKAEPLAKRCCSLDVMHNDCTDHNFVQIDSTNDGRESRLVLMRLLSTNFETYTSLYMSGAYCTYSGEGR